VPTGLFSERGFRTCRSGLETGRPVTLIPSETTQQYPLNIQCTWTQQPEAWETESEEAEGEMERETTIFYDLCEEGTLLYSHNSSDSEAVNIVQTLSSPPLSPSTVLSLSASVCPVFSARNKIKIYNVTVWNMMRWKSLVINKATEYVCRSGSLEHTQVDKFYLSSTYG